MGKIKESFDWFKGKQSTSIFAVISLIGGFLFLNQGITGNVILDKDYSINLISIIGMFLIVCSIILGLYSLRKK